jgi:cytochrome c551
MDKAVKGLVGILAAGLVVSIGLAFSGAGVHPGQNKPAAEQAAATSQADNSAVEKTVKTTCAACHGADLKGQVGPNLYNVHTKYNKEQIVEILKNGKPGGMPAGLVPGQEEAVAAYLMNLK